MIKYKTRNQFRIHSFPKLRMVEVRITVWDRPEDIFMKTETTRYSNDYKMSTYNKVQKAKHTCCAKTTVLVDTLLQFFSVTNAINM